jgi:hypothetical protein
VITNNTPPKTQPFSPRKSLGIPPPDSNLIKREKSTTLNKSKKSQPKNSDVNEPNRKLESAKKLKTTKYAAHGELKKELQHRKDLIESNLTREDHVLKSQLSLVKVENSDLILEIENLNQQLEKTENMNSLLKKKNRVLQFKTRSADDEKIWGEKHNNVLVRNCQDFINVMKETLDNMPSKKLRNSYSAKLGKTLENFEQGIGNFDLGLQEHVSILQDHEKSRENTVDASDQEVEIETKTDTPKFPSDTEDEKELKKVAALPQYQMLSTGDNRNIVNSEVVSDDAAGSKDEVRRSEPKQRQLPQEEQDTCIYEEPVFKQTFGQEGSPEQKELEHNLEMFREMEARKQQEQFHHEELVRNQQEMVRRRQAETANFAKTQPNLQKKSKPQDDTKPWSKKSPTPSSSKKPASVQSGQSMAQDKRSQLRKEQEALEKKAAGQLRDRDFERSLAGSKDNMSEHGSPMVDFTVKTEGN